MCTLPPFKKQKLKKKITEVEIQNPIGLNYWNNFCIFMT